MEREKTIDKQNQYIRSQVAMLNIFQQNIHSIAKLRDQEQLKDAEHLEVFDDPPILLLSLSHWASFSTNLENTLMLIDNSPDEVQLGWVKAREVISRNIDEDPLKFQINGTSLFDISQMPLPLAKSDINQIDSMIKKPAKQKKANPEQPTDHTQYVQNVILFAATQAELQRRAPLSDQVRPTLRRIKDYWEYYTVWVTNSDPNNESFLLMHKLITGGNLLSGLLPFISTRLQITPSSTYRLIDSHVENYNPVLKFIWRHGRFAKSLSDRLHSFPPVRGLPITLHPYQFTDPNSERKLAGVLKDAYRKKDTSIVEEPETLARKIADLYHRNLRDAVSSSLDRFLKIPTPSDSFFREILAGVIYGKTLTIIGLTEEAQTFVTMDLLQNGQLFGIPGHLKNNPQNIKDKLIQDLLTPVLEEARRRNPLAEYKPTVKTLTSNPNQNREPIIVDKPVKAPKRRILRQIFPSSPMPKLSAETLPQEEPEKHLLVFKGQIVDPTNLISIAEEIAADLIRKDRKKLKNDIVLLIESLLEDPNDSVATYKITDAEPIKEPGQNMALRSFRGDLKRLPFGNKKYSDRLRTVYYIDPRTRTVNLVEIINHDDFDKKYGGFGH